MEIEGKRGKQGKFSIVLVTVIYKPIVKKNTKSCNSMFEFRSRRSLSKTQHCLSQDVSNKILLCYH